MNINKIFSITLLFVLAIFLNSCGPNSQFGKKYDKPFKHNVPLIKDQNIVASGKSEISKTLEMGPKPVIGDTVKLGKRKKITSEAQKNYLIISDDYPLLKQRISLKFKNLDYKQTMKLMGKIGEINILVGDEVAGAISAELIDVPWDKAFQALLDMKNFASDVDTASNLIRVHSPETLTNQEQYKSDRAAAVKKKVELEDSVEPIFSEIFRLYYITPAQAKKTIEELFSAGDGGSVITITEETTTRSIIVRGQKEDLDVIDAVIKEIDVKTKQVLIEAFIVDVTSTFAKALGSRIGAMTKKGTGDTSSTTISGTIGGAATTSTGVTLGAAAGTVTNNSITGATSGIGIIKMMGADVLKIELEALQSLGLNEILSSPSVFTLNNQEATITQGDQIPYQTTSDGTTTTEFKEAALSLTVTPSIIGDGNVLLDIQVNNDAPKTIFIELFFLSDFFSIKSEMYCSCSNSSC